MRVYQFRHSGAWTANLAPPAAHDPYPGTLHAFCTRREALQHAIVPDTTAPAMSRPILVLVALLVATSVAAQRPRPYPVVTPPDVQRAIAAGTRTADGRPGPRYWQNTASYRLDARLDPTTTVLSATGTITYRNASPDTLRFLVLKLRQNIHAPGVPRNRPVTVTGGLSLAHLAVEGQAMAEVGGLPEPGQYRIDGTILTLQPRTPVLPGATAVLDAAWSYPVPPSSGAFRQGQDGEVYFLGYWYPQMAVYDDLDGWSTDPYLGNGEHYMGYASYDVSLDVPAGWLVRGPGVLVNADDVLTDETRVRLARAATADSTVHVVTAEERGRATRAGPDGRAVWRWHADDVRDFSLSASAAYVWDATSAAVDQTNSILPAAPERVAIHTLYRPGTASWERSAEFEKASIEHLSRLVMPYPYPAMTAVEGLIGGGMEYPMMTLVGGAHTDGSLFSVIYHETSHMWFPMIVGSNEPYYQWMDEGLTSYDQNWGISDVFDGSSAGYPRIDAWARGRQAHFRLAGTGNAVEPMRHNDLFPIGSGSPQVDPVGGSARTVASYSTPAVMLHALETLVSRDRFLAAYRDYARTWAFKHPAPGDFFGRIEAGLGQDLDWLWTPTLFETWTVDHAIASVTPHPDGVRVVVRDLGLAPFPATVAVTYSDGRVERLTVPVETWLGGATEATLVFPAGVPVRAEAEGAAPILDVDLLNDVWTSGG